MSPRATALILGASASLLASCSLAAPPTRDSEPSVREVRIEALPPESPEHGLFGQPLTQHTLLARIDALAHDDKARGILLRMGPLEGAFARAAELARALPDGRFELRASTCP